MNKGFVVLHRKITEWEWYSDTNTLRVFLHLLLTANHKPSKFRGFEVGRGQIIIGRKALAENLNLTEREVRTAIDHLKTTGELTIKDVTKTIKLDVEYGGLQKDPWGNTKAGFTITGKLNRKDFGLLWNVALEAGGVLVGEEVKISCDIQLSRQA